jgi:hypothetical protein
MKQLPKLYLERPTNTHIKVFERICTELTKYMTEWEIDQVVSFMSTIEHSKHDINPSIGDSETQLKIMLGSDRYQEIKDKWKADNQKLLTVFGTKKYRYKKGGDKTLFDGLDPTDNPDDFDVIYI